MELLWRRNWWCRDNVSQGNAFDYKTKITWKTPERPPQSGNKGDDKQPVQPPVSTSKGEFIIPVKYVNHFRRSLNLPLVNCEVEFDLSWAKDCVFMQHHNNIKA